MSETIGCAAIVGDEMDFIHTTWFIKARSVRTNLKTCFVFVHGVTVSTMTAF